MDHEHKNTRITIEKMTVTTIRRRSRLYCSVCGCEVEATAGKAIETKETKLLTTGDEQETQEETGK